MDIFSHFAWFYALNISRDLFQHVGGMVHSIYNISCVWSMLVPLHSIVKHGPTHGRYIFFAGPIPYQFVWSYKDQWVKLHWSTAEVLVGLFYIKEKHLSNIQTHNNQNSYVGWNTDGWTNIRWPDVSVIHWPKTFGQRSTKNGIIRKFVFEVNFLR